MSRAAVAQVSFTRGSSIRCHFWRWWLKYSFAQVAQILVSTWLRFSLTFTDIYLIVEEGFYKRTLDIHRTLGLLLHTQVSIQQLLKLPAECFHPKPKVNSVLIKLMKKIGCHMEAVLSKENQPALPTHNKILTQIKSTCSVSKVLDEGQYKAGESTRHIISRLFFNFSKA